MCVTANACSGSDFKFLGVRSASGLSVLQSDGVCGIAPMDDGGNTNPVMAIFKNRYPDGRPILLANILTIHFEGISGTSWIDIGEPSAGELAYVWAKMPDNSQRWGLAMYGMNIGGL